MAFNFMLQSNTSEENTLTELRSAAAGSERGQALFAWATVPGLKALLDSPEIQNLLHTGSLDLIIGLDAVTNEATVKYARALVSQHPTLSIRFFLHDERWFFHPKTAWFISATGEVTVVTGSGNLTKWGLSHNWEAAIGTTLAQIEAAQVVSRFSSWEAEHAAQLRAADDPTVLERAVLNRPVERAAFSQLQPTDLKPDSDLQMSGTPHAPWLLTELTKNRKNPATQLPMFSQASFSGNVATNYFGYEETPATVISIYPVDDEGFINHEQTTAIRFKASTNYYFELNAYRGIDYPATGRPIAAFRRIAADRFLYVVLLPGEDGFDDAFTLCHSKPSVDGGGAGHMHRAYFSDTEVANRWPSNPIMALDQA
ncbi:phospholipase D family protein [Curtobacterium herbarum]|uniref:Phospholipase D-like domain-containing protein n=1 Tax=Curtobacterium herbarum TaxID=150122 RepID=A0ABN1ZF30_9MICO|nr:phospholipase D family protein [Curtobacterium herbarum]MBM7474355.1 hypothetical protein [Curtobacterium herbarum]MCS6545741.1 phospholipase D family protein [Curtobacterium herbarum]